MPGVICPRISDPRQCDNVTWHKCHSSGASHPDTHVTPGWRWTQSPSQMPEHKSGGMLHQNGHYWGIKQTVKFKFISLLASELFQVSEMFQSNFSLFNGWKVWYNYWKLDILGFCNWIKSNYELKLDLDCSETGSISCPDSIWGLTLVWTWQQGMVLTLKYGGY